MAGRWGGVLGAGARMAGAKSRQLAEACQATHRECMAASPVCLVHLVGLVYLVYLVCLVYLVSFVQPNKRDRPNRPDGPDEPDLPGLRPYTPGGLLDRPQPSP